MNKKYLKTSTALIILLTNSPALAVQNNDLQTLQKEIQEMKHKYENRIAELEIKLNSLEKKQISSIPAPVKTTTPLPSNKQAATSDNSFNPAIGMVLNGTYGAFSQKESSISGVALPGEGAHKEEGFKLGESELNFSSNVDDKFRGSLTTAFVNEEGEDAIEIEEAFIETLPGTGLPTGMNIKAGRALWTLGYLNEQHAHAHDFADRPLPYRMFLNNAYNDDGAELTYLLPTSIYSEIGGGLFRADDYPFGSAEGGGAGAWSGFARIGDDIGQDQTWRIGGYVLSGTTDERSSNEDTVNFVGDTNLYVTDLRYTWAPTGNADEQELLLQGEYMWRSEDGAYEDTSADTGLVGLNDHSSGWYAQTVYKFLPQWRVGYRYSQITTPDTPVGLIGSALDSGNHTPDAHAVMVDWTNSEFSRIRLQYNREELARGNDDNQIMLQYIMSLGAHGAHKY